MNILGLNILTNGKLKEEVRKSVGELLDEKAVGNIYGVQGYDNELGLFDNKGNKDEMLKSYASWVYACASTRAEFASSAKFRIYERKGADDYVELDDHPSLLILDNPNPMDTKIDLIAKANLYRDLTGDAYIAKYKNLAGRLSELWVLPSQWMHVVPSKNGVVEKYELRPYGLRSDKDMITYYPDEIIHWKHPNPNNMYYGASVVMSAAQSVDINTEQHEYQRHFYKNSALPPIVLAHPQKIQPDVQKRLRQSFEQMYGGNKNANKVAILEGGLTMEKLGINPKDLDWLATNSMTMKEICGIFKVPPSMLGIVDDVNRATAESQEYTFAKAAIEPILTSFDQRITKDLLRYYLDGQRLFMKHDSTVPMDELRRAQAGQYRISSGQTTINEERKEQGYNGVTGGDTLLVPANLTTIDKLIAGENNPTNQPDLTNGDGNG